MQIELGASVRTSDGQDAGVLKKLILDPSGERVKSVVIEKGLLLKEDVELPVEAIHAVPGEPITVNYTADQMKDLPRYDETKYTSPPPDIGARFGYPTSGLIWPAPNPYPAYMNGPAVAYPIVAAEAPLEETTDEPGELGEIREDLDRNNAVIGPGADVYSRDGEKVGEVETVEFDTETGHPTRVVVKKGWLFTEDIELPAGTIASADDGVLTLNVDKNRVEAWRSDNTVPLY